MGNFNIHNLLWSGNKPLRIEKDKEDDNSSNNTNQDQDLDTNTNNPNTINLYNPYN